jgi:hypothetical protein
VWPPPGCHCEPGLYTWHPYEPMNWAMLPAAATTLHLAADGEIIPCGRLGSAPTPGIRQQVYAGDQSKGFLGGTRCVGMACRRGGRPTTSPPSCFLAFSIYVLCHAYAGRNPRGRPGGIYRIRGRYPVA